MNGLGRSAVVTFRNAPGFTPLDVTNAARPVSTSVGLASPVASLVAPAASSKAKRTTVFMIRLREIFRAGAFASI